MNSSCPHFSAASWFDRERGNGPLENWSHAVNREHLPAERDWCLSLRPSIRRVILATHLSKLHAPIGPAMRRVDRHSERPLCVRLPNAAVSAGGLLFPVPVPIPHQPVHAFFAESMRQHPSPHHGRRRRLPARAWRIRDEISVEPVANAMSLDRWRSIPAEFPGHGLLRNPGRVHRHESPTPAIEHCQKLPV